MRLRALVSHARSQSDKPTRAAAEWEVTGSDTSESVYASCELPLNLSRAFLLSLAIGEMPFIQLWRVVLQDFILSLQLKIAKSYGQIFNNTNEQIVIVHRIWYYLETVIKYIRKKKWR